MNSQVTTARVYPMLDPKSQTGSITILFCLFGLILMGALSYSITVGRKIAQKQELYRAADAETITMANHAASGLNYIAANNLAIGAAIHVAAAVPVISRQVSLLRAAISTCDDLADVHIPAGLDPDNSVFQKDYFDSVKGISKQFFTAASGTSMLNRQIAKFWLYAALPKGLEIARLNSPGSVSIPMQVGKPIRSESGLASKLKFKYQGLKSLSTIRTLCHTIESSQTVGSRNNFFDWIMGPVNSVLGSGEPPPSASNDFGRVENTYNDRMNSISDNLDSKIAESDWACEIIPDSFPPIVKDRGVCNKNREMRNMRSQLNEVQSSTPWAFEECGLNLDGSLSKKAEKFLENPDENTDLSFIYPDTDNQAAEFYGSIAFAALLGQASSTGDSSIGDSSRAGNSIGAEQSCVSGWTEDYGDSHVKCGSPKLVDQTFGSLIVPSDAKKFFLRTQWVTSQAGAVYHGSGDDPIPGDPKLSLFWPAWRTTLQQSKVGGDFLSLWTEG